MSKENSIKFWVGILIFLQLICNPLISKAEEKDFSLQIEQANLDFEEERYTDALDKYEVLYSKGVFTQKMLYRLSFLHENLKNYPEAIYYLKKSRQEYGGTAVDNKIKQLMQTQGATRFFSTSGWDSYLQFFTNWGWMVWIMALLTAGYIVFHFLTIRRGLPSWRRLAFGVAVLPFLVSATLLYLRGFAMPERAVITAKTSYYDFPSYAASHDATALPVGETVNILDQNDIWLQVGAGEEVYWVPQWTIRRL